MDKDDKGGESLETKLDALNDGDALDPVTIEIGDDGAGTVIETTTKEPTADGDDDEGDGKPKLKRKQGRFNKRLGELTGELGEARRGLNLLQQENERLKKESEQNRKKAEASDEAAMANYEVAVKSRVEKAEKELEEAHASGDSKKIAAATVEAGKAASDMARVEAWRKAQPAKAEPKDDDKGGDATHTDQRPAQRVDPLFNAFREENTWFDPGTRESPNPDFRLHMHAYAVTVGKQLERQYAEAGKPIDAAYWATVSDKVVAKFAEEFDDEGDEPEAKPQPPSRKTPAMKPDGNPIGRASSQSGNGSQSAGKTERITLNSDQMGMVQANIDAGIYVHPDGKPYTRQEGAKRFAEAIARDRRKQAMERGDQP